MDIEASSSSERPAEADLNQNKRCLDTWSDIHNEAISASCDQINGKSYNKDIEDMGANKKKQ